jgi:hypothetical protein
LNPTVELVILKDCCRPGKGLEMDKSSLASMGLLARAN